MQNCPTAIDVYSLQLKNNRVFNVRDGQVFNWSGEIPAHRTVQVRQAVTLSSRVIDCKYGIYL